VIRICEKILAVQAEIDPAATQISPQAVERGIDMYCAQMADEVYGADVAKDIQRAGRELFTINYLASEVFKQPMKIRAEIELVRGNQVGW
jgi:hypothetical protein